MLQQIQFNGQILFSSIAQRLKKNDALSMIILLLRWHPAPEKDVSRSFNGKGNDNIFAVTSRCHDHLEKIFDNP